MDFIKLEEDFKGGIPSGYDLVVAEADNIEETACVLYGFDELNMFDGDFTNPVHGFASPFG